MKKEIPAAVQTIAEDAQGNLWLGTWGKGIVKYNPDDGKVRFYDTEDGIPDLLFHLQKGFSSQFSGKMYFTSNEGIVEFHPDSIRDNPNPPPVFITTIKTFKKNQSSGEIETIEEDITYQSTIQKSYRDNIVTFEFAVLSYFKPSKNRYAYQLEGFSDEWIQLGTKKEVTFTNLSPGNYTLRVKGANGDGYWNDTPKELKITISPPWYWTWSYSTW